MHGVLLFQLLERRKEMNILKILNHFYLCQNYDGIHPASIWISVMQIIW